MYVMSVYAQWRGGADCYDLCLFFKYIHIFNHYISKNRVEQNNFEMTDNLHVEAQSHSQFFLSLQ